MTESPRVTREKLGSWEILELGLLDRGRALPTWVCLVLVAGQCLCCLLAFSRVH